MCHLSPDPSTDVATVSSQLQTSALLLGQGIEQIVSCRPDRHAAIVVPSSENSLHKRCPMGLAPKQASEATRQGNIS